jgi:hypothetical protein
MRCSRFWKPRLPVLWGAESYQRNEVLRGWRNGYKPRTLKTRVESWI